MGVLFIADSPQHEPNHHISGFLWLRCVVWGGCEETKIIFCQHQRHYLYPPDYVHLLLQLSSTSCLRWEKEEKHLLLGTDQEREEKHLLGWDGTRGSSSAVHNQQGKQGS